MSGSIALSSAALTDAEKADLRRFCGYQAYGTGASGFAGWRFFQVAGVLEYRMNNFAPAEFQVARQYLAQLYVMEFAIPGAGATLNVGVAAVFTRNAKEMSERRSLFNGWRTELCGFMGVPPGPNLASGSSATRVHV